MGIGVQGESGGEVAQHAGDGLDINTILQGEGGKGVPKLVEATNGYFLVEAENDIWYDIVRGYGIRRSRFH